MSLCAALACMALAGCTRSAQVRALSNRTHLSATTVAGTDFQHQIFARPAMTDDLLVVFIDGDGQPYVAGGTQVAADPTPHRPLALELAAQTPGAVLYLGRPCNFLPWRDRSCNASLWTSQRYSNTVVASMVTALQRFSRDRFQRLLLIGYSGGGTLAVLMAPRLQHVIGVVTIAANLDIDAWTTWHGYLPLNGSLNPSRLQPLPRDLPQWHLVGDQDTNSPAWLSEHYWAGIAPEHIWHYPQFDHVCCWAEQWPTILARIRTSLDND
jgi:poly(3-hydroxybutyrate) depolymerase